MRLYLDTNNNYYNICIEQLVKQLKTNIMTTSVENLKVVGKKVDDQRISLIEKLIKLGFSPEEAKETVGRE